jgi:hypothetical protein
MVNTVKKIASLHVDLTMEERVLFSAAWKSYISKYRDAREHIALIQTEEKKSENSDQVQLTSETQAAVEKKILQICNELVHILDKDLLPYASPGNSSIFLMKMFEFLFVIYGLVSGREIIFDIYVSFLVMKNVLLLRSNLWKRIGLL